MKIRDIQVVCVAQMVAIVFSIVIGIEPSSSWLFIPISFGICMGAFWLSDRLERDAEASQ